MAVGPPSRHAEIALLSDCWSQRRGEHEAAGYGRTSGGGAGRDGSLSYLKEMPDCRLDSGGRAPYLLDVAANVGHRIVGSGQAVWESEHEVGGTAAAIAATIAAAD